MAAIQTSVRYEADGQTALWPVPFPFGASGDIGVKIVGADGREKRLTEGADYVLSGACVLAVIPAGNAVVIWLDAPVEEALAAARRQAATGPAYAGPAYAGAAALTMATTADMAQTVPAQTTPGAGEAALVSELSDLRTQLAALREERETALAAARAAQADAQVRRLTDEGAAGVARLAEEAATRIAELESTAASLSAALREQAAQITRERAALAEAQGRLEAALNPARESLSALDARVSAAQREALTLQTLTAEGRDATEDAAAAAEAARKGAESAQRGAEAARQGAENARDLAEASFRAAEVTADRVAGERARAEQAAGASADSEGDAAVWADAAAESAEQAFGSAQCAWRAAWQASVAAQPERPGLAAFAATEEILSALSGAYFLNSHVRRGPAVFTGLWPLSDMARDGGWDGVFFLGPPYPDVPTPPPAPLCAPPVRPDGPGGEDGAERNPSGVWGPCGAG